MTPSRSHEKDATGRPFHGKLKGFGKRAGKILLAVAVLSLFAQMSWNMFAPDMLGLEPIRMKQALGLVIFAGVFASLLRFGGRHLGHESAPETR